MCDSIKNPTIIPSNKKSFFAPDTWDSGDAQYKLYVWKDADDGHRGMAFAVAKSESDAKQLVIKEYERFHGGLYAVRQNAEDIYWGDVTVSPIQEYGNCIFG